MDKELLKKHRFWFIMGGYFFLFFILWLCVMFGTSGAAEKKRTEVKDAQDKIDGWAKGKKPKNPSFVTPWAEYQKKFADQKDSVSEKAFVVQQDLYDWPAHNKID